MTSSSPKKKSKLEETKASENAFALESTEERLMLLFDRYKSRKRTGGIVDDDTLVVQTTWKKDRTCHHCFHSIEPTHHHHLNPQNQHPFFRLQRFKYNRYTPLATIRLHMNCMKKIVWRIATKQAYSITVLPKYLRSYIRDILLRTHKGALEWTVRKLISTPKQ